MEAVSRSSQQENDYYMDGARKIKKLAESLCDDTFDFTSDLNQHYALCSQELKYLLDELTSLNVGDVHFVLRGRVQYFVASTNYLCDRVTLIDLKPLLDECIKGLVQLSNILVEMVTARVVQSGGIDVTSWFVMSHIAVNSLLVKIFQVYPSSRLQVDISLSECMTMCASSDWQTQYLSLGIILATVINEYFDWKRETDLSSALPKGSSKLSNGSKKVIASKLQASASTPAISSLPIENKLLTSQSSKRNSSTVTAKTRATMKETSTSSKVDASKKSTISSSDDLIDSNANSGLIIKVVTPTASSTKALLSSRSFKAVNSEEEMCKSGFYRTLTWLLLHHNLLVRNLTCDIFVLTVVKSLAEKTEQNNAMLSDLLSCFLEQGVVSHLEYVCQGISVQSNHNPSEYSLFPEPKIRNTAKVILDSFATNLVSIEPARNRVLNAMLHSGNTKLRLNIFSGLVYCCTHHKNYENNAGGNELGRLIWNTRSSSLTNSIGMSTNTPFDVVVDAIGPGGGIFHDLLMSLTRDITELRNLLAVISHFLRMSISVRQQAKLVEISTQTTNTINENELIVNIEPTVVIVDTDRVNRMKCPSCSIIATHSNSLSTLFSNAILYQINQIQAKQSNPKSISVAIDNLDNSNFPTFCGSFRVWQEIFSHMVDTFIMKSSISSMSVADLIEAFHIATRYSMNNLLTHYTQVLAERINIHSFIQIFQASVGLRLKAQLLQDKTDSTENYHLNLELSYACVDFLNTHAEKLITSKRPQEIAEIVKCLRRVVYFLLIS